MHTPSLITSHVAAEVAGAHMSRARTYREARRERPGGRLRRRTGGSRPLVPRGRAVPPLAH